jgi:hypothetical protein
MCDILLCYNTFLEETLLFIEPSSVMLSKDVDVDPSTYAVQDIALALTSEVPCNVCRSDVSKLF